MVRYNGGTGDGPTHNPESASAGKYFEEKDAEKNAERKAEDAKRKAKYNNVSNCYTPDISKSGNDEVISCPLCNKTAGGRAKIITHTFNCNNRYKRYCTDNPDGGSKKSKKSRKSKKSKKSKNNYIS